MSSLTKTTYKRGLETPSMSRHDDYLHAPLQLFHHAVKLDMQNMNLGGESWWFKKKQKQIRIPLLVLLENDKMVQWITTAVCVCECEKPGPCIERGLPVGTMDATTPTPSPQPTSQRAFIWACTWVLQLCLAKRVCAPEQGSWVPSQNSPGTLAANPPTFLRQQPTRIKNKHSMNPIFFLTKSNNNKKRFSRINNSSEITD